MIFWLLVSLLLIMAGAATCADLTCNETLVWVGILGTWAVELALLALWGANSGPHHRHSELITAVVVIGVPIACILGYALVDLAS